MNGAPLEPWEWTGQREDAAVLVADDRLTDEQIALQLGIGERTIRSWKGEQPFRDRVNTLREAFRQQVREHGIANVERRVEILDDLCDRLRRVLDCRAQAAPEDETLCNVPGATTGLLIRKLKPTRDGGFLEEFVIDTGLLGELRATLTQAAKELGQWKELHDVTTAGQPFGVPVFGDLPEPELDRRLARSQRGEAAPDLPAPA